MSIQSPDCSRGSARRLALVLLLLPATSNAQAVEPKPADQAAGLFHADKLLSFHLRIDAKNWEAIQPGRAPGWFGMPAARSEKAPAEKPPPGPPRGAFGYDFEFVRGDLEFDGKTWKNVGVRFKGNSSYAMSAKSLKKPFKIDFDRYVDGGNFHGLKMINLANNAFDPSQLREALAYSVFRDAGVPAPRTAFAELYLTVPGKHDRAYVGLYTLIEQVDPAFLKNHFKNGKGLLLKPEGIQNLPYLGQQWDRYERSYRPKKEPGEKAKQRLIAFLQLVNFADDAAFAKDINQYLNVDLFLRYLAACSAMVNQGSFVGFGHNYYLYLNPGDDRFVILPWDLNNTFGGLSMFGGVDLQVEWSIAKPYLGRNRLSERILSIPEYSKQYREQMRSLAEQSFTAERLGARLDAMQKVVQPALDREEKERTDEKERGTGLMGMMIGKPAELRDFTTRRAASLTAQLEGKSKGKSLGAGGGPFGQRDSLGKQVSKRLFTALDVDKDGSLTWQEVNAGVELVFQESDSDKKGDLGERALANVLRKKLTPPSTFFGRLLSAPPTGDFGQGVHLAGYVFYHLGKSELASKDLAGLGLKLFHKADADGDGKLTEAELIAGLDALPPASPAWGPGPPEKAAQ